MFMIYFSHFVAIFFFFMQKTAYALRISDWSSDVCSSDLLGMLPRRHSRGAGGCPFATAPDDLSQPVAWRPELTAVTVILDAAPEGFETAVPVDPRALGALLADVAGIDGRHVRSEERRVGKEGVSPGRSVWWRDR